MALFIDLLHGNVASTGAQIRARRTNFLSIPREPWSEATCKMLNVAPLREEPQPPVKISMLYQLVPGRPRLEAEGWVRGWDVAPRYPAPVAKVRVRGHLGQRAKQARESLCEVFEGMFVKTSVETFFALKAIAAGDAPVDFVSGGKVRPVTPEEAEAAADCVWAFRQQVFSAEARYLELLEQDRVDDVAGVIDLDDAWPKWE